MIATLGIAVVLVGVKFSQRISSVAQYDSPDRGAVLPSDSTPEVPSKTTGDGPDGPTPTEPEPKPRPKPEPKPEPKAQPADDGAEGMMEQDDEKPLPEGPGDEEMAPEEPDAEETDEAPADEAPPAEAPAAAGVFADIIGRDRRLLLPEPGPRGPVELAKILVDSPTECELSLHGVEIAFGDGPTPTIEQTDADGVRTWTILVKAGLGKGRPIVVFSLAGQSLTCECKEARFGPGYVEHLRYCLLVLKAKGESVSCFLSEPREVEPPKVSFLKHEQTVAIPLAAHWLTQAEHLRIDVEFADFPPYDVDPAGDLGHKEVATVHVSPPESDDAGVLNVGLEFEAAVDMEVCFEVDRTCMLVLSTFTLPEWREPGADSEGKVKINRSWLASEAKDLNEEMSTVRAAQRKIDDELRKAGIQMTAGGGRQAATMQRNAETKNRLNEDRRKYAEAVEAWQTDMRKIFDAVEAEGRIKFRLYVKIRDEQIVLLQTRDEGNGDEGNRD